LAVHGRLTERDLLLIGAAVYRCEGSRSKPWRRSERSTFINSDPGILRLFLRFLAVCGRERDALLYRVHIHESVDAADAVAWWAAELDLPVSAFQRPTIKRHQPRTTRANTGEDYHGCPVVRAPASRELYWRVEGVMNALTGLT
jgi:hypothetical protein